MKTPVSVVIICCNEAAIIGRTIAAAMLFSDDVVLVDSGSTDGTQKIVVNAGARLLETRWDGYGRNKNKGVAIAKYDWVLSIDADEIPDEKLVNALNHFQPLEDKSVYSLRFRSFLGNKMIRFGEWANESHTRLYHRKHASWNEAQVHESLQVAANASTEILPGFVQHFTADSLNDFRNKSVQYAELNAVKYYEAGKKAGLLKCYLATIFSFIMNYIFRLGFLDGSAGLTVARMNAWYTWLKYRRLMELNKKDKPV